MESRRSLRVLMPRVAGQRFTCQRCTLCCRQTVVPLTGDDRARIERHDWPHLGGVPPYVRLAGQWVLNKRGDGACVFLGDNGLCLIHERHGAAAKPLACRLFPFAAAPDRDGRLRGTWRFDCPTVARSEGRPVTAIAPELTRLVGAGPGPPDRAHGQAGRTMAGDVDGVVERFDAWFADPGLGWDRRLTGAVRVTETAASGGRDISNDGGALADLFDRERERAPDTSRSAAGPRDRRLLREMVFAHADMATLQQRRAGRWARARRSWSRYRAAAVLCRGTRRTPAMHDLPAGVSFAAIESVGPAGDDAEPVAELMSRYLRTRLQSRTFFGPGFHGWSVTDGLRALWSAAVITAWVSRWLAAADGCASIRHEDVVRALGKVDLATMQLPAVRRTTVRWRLEHLGASGGLLKLAQGYCMVAAMG